MKDSSIRRSSDKTDSSLSLRLVIGASVLLFLLALLTSLVLFMQVRHMAVEHDLRSYNGLLSNTILPFTDVRDINWQQNIKTVGEQLIAGDSVSQLAIYSPNGVLFWSSAREISLNNRDKEKLTALRDNSMTQSWVWDSQNKFFETPSFDSFVNIIRPESDEYQTLSVVTDNNVETFYNVKSIRDYNNARKMAILSASLCFAIVFFGGFLVFFIFSKLSRKNLNVIKRDEEVLNEQVSKLSVLLDDNKQLQQNMKTANARAVELNERFLRRVGSDLHDGPAQSIGYAVLRLNQVSSKKISDELNFEFHAIKEALNESLDEIRGISSGLVLPELEQMSLEDAIRKVIQRHRTNTGTEVNESYTDLPEAIPLPIKICAYRFVQEGLNNAHNHGSAKKCRFNAQMIGDVLQLTLKDNGIGFRKSVLNTDGGHLGLIGLKDRIESLGGKLAINSELGAGTALKVSINIADEFD